MVDYRTLPKILGDGRSGAPAARRFQYLEWAATALVAFFLASGLHQLFVTNINWDEFYFLSFVHLYRNGELALPLQTFHVHFFSWLPWISDSEIWQIFAARGVVWFVGLASTWLIYRIAGRFCGRLGALFAAILYLSFTYVMDHGLSFRTDPFCAFFILLAIHLLVNKAGRRYALPLAAFCTAVAAMISLKSALYAPTIGVLLVAPLLAKPPQWRALAAAAFFGLCFAVSLAGLYFLHRLALAPTPVAEAGVFAAMAGSKTLGAGRLFPAWPFILRAVVGNSLTWILIACGLWVAGRRFFAAGRRVEAAMILSLALPLLSLLVYRNAFPYFFVFLMPSAVVLAAVAVDELQASAIKRRSVAVFAGLALTLAVTTATYGLNYARNFADQTVAQTETVDLVHRMFPDPVPYIDRNAMIASFPKVGFFMSTWGLESYRARNRPVMADLIARHAPPLLIANTPTLDLSRPPEAEENDSRYILFPEDFEILRENYVPHWGAVYVAGKRLDLPAGAGPQTFSILVAGPYTLEADGPVNLDGESVAPGAHVTLTRGTHTIAATDDTARHATLRWGRDLYRPAQPPSPQPIYFGF